MLTAALVIGTAGCRSDDGDPPAVGIDAYRVVLGEFLPDPAGSDGDRPVVWVAKLGDEPFTLDDQVAMIEDVEDSHDLRFVDSIDAAVDGEDADSPPRDGGVLLGIGTVAPSAPTGAP